MKIAAIMLSLSVLALLWRALWLGHDLPIDRLGASGVFLLDEGAYQLSALHKHAYGSWRLDDTHYFGWTIRGYQLWLLPFIKILGPQLFALRLLSVTAASLAVALFLISLALWSGRALVVASGLVLALNFPFSMWARLASPYPVCLLPIAACLYLAVADASRPRPWLTPSCMALLVALSVTIKESTVFFIPVFFLALAFRPKDLRLGLRQAALFLACCIGLVLSYYLFYLKPHAAGWWNGTAENAASGVLAFANPSVDWLRRIYLNAFELPNFAGYPAVAVLALAGVTLIRLGRHAAEAQRRFNATMLIWLAGGISFLAIGNAGVSQAVLITPHYAQLFLPPLCYFACVAACEPLRQSPRLRRLGLGLLLGFTLVILFPTFRLILRGVAPGAAFGAGWEGRLLATRAALLSLAVFGMVAVARPRLNARWRFAAVSVLGISLLGVDLLKFFDWAARPPARPALPEIARRFQDRMLELSENARPVVLQLDAMYLVGRAPAVEVIGLRAFHLQYLDRLYSRWKPQFLVIQDRIGDRRYAESALSLIAQSGFQFQKVDEAALGSFDGWNHSALLLKLEQPRDVGKI